MKNNYFDENEDEVEVEDEDEVEVEGIRRRILRKMEKINRYREEKLQINGVKSFKSNGYVLCLTNPPNVLFCNCGHLCICSVCDEIKQLDICIICKTNNPIKRMIDKKLKLFPPRLGLMYGPYLLKKKYK